MASLSTQGFYTLKAFEGMKNMPYHLRGERYYTVGIGHNGPDVIPGRFYSDAECMAFFARDKLRFEADVNRVWHSPMTQNMFDALFFVAYGHGNVSHTVLGRAVLGNGWQNKARISAIWRNLYTVGGLLRKRRLKELAYFYGDTDVGGDFDAGDYSGYGGGGGGYGDNSYNTADRYRAGGYAAGAQPNDYQTFTSIYSGAELNTSRTASVKLPIDTSTVKHTRIYKFNDASIIVDELSMPLDEGKMKTTNTSTGTVTTKK